MKVGNLQTFAKWINWTCKAALTTFFYMFIGAIGSTVWELVSLKFDEKDRVEQAYQAQKQAAIDAQKKTDDDYFNTWLTGCLTEHKKYKCQVIWAQSGLR